MKHGYFFRHGSLFTNERDSADSKIIKSKKFEILITRLKFNEKIVKCYVNRVVCISIWKILKRMFSSNIYIRDIQINIWESLFLDNFQLLWNFNSKRKQF